MATKPVFSGSSTADKEAYKQQLLDYYVQSGDTSPTVVSDIKYGNLNYGNINKAGTLEYSLYNPINTAKTSTGLTEANQIFSSATGKQLTGDGLVAVEGALRQGYSATDALKNLGDLSNYAKFSTDYNGGTSGGPAGPGGADLSGTPGFWEASPGVTTPQATQNPLQAIPNPFAGYQGGNATTTSIVDYLGSLGKATDFASRKALAEQAGIANYTGTAAQNTQLLGMLRGSSPVSSVITPSSLESAKGVTLPGVTGSNLNQADAVVAGAGTTIAELIKQLTPSETPEDKQKQGILDSMLKELQSNDGLEAEKLKAEQAAGIPEIRQQLADINAQILSKTAEYNVLQAANANKPITMNSIIGNERAILNAKAADIGLLEAQALGIQGKITAAEQRVNDAIELKFSIQQHRLDIYQAQLNAIQPTLDKQERLRAQAQQILVDRQNQALADAKQSEKVEKDYLLDLMSKYPDAKISLTDSIESAQGKVSTSRIYQQDTRLAGGGGSSGGGSGVYSGVFPVSPVSTTPQPQRIQIPFDQWLREEELKARQSFSQEKRDALRKQYDAANATPAQPTQTADLSKYDWRVQQVINGNMSAADLITGGTKAERSALTQQLADAQKRGLLKPQASPKQLATFNSIVDKYNKSPLIAAADRTVVLKNTINQVKQNPNNGTLQLNLVYSYIQALDTYQSAVREGELGLVNSIDSTYGKLKNQIEKIQNGQIVRPEVAKQIAEAAQSIVSTISQGAQAKEKTFASQARANGIESLWSDFQGGFTAPYEQTQSTSGQTSTGLKYTIVQ